MSKTGPNPPNRSSKCSICAKIQPMAAFNGSTGRLPCGILESTWLSCSLRDPGLQVISSDGIEWKEMPCSEFEISLLVLSGFYMILPCVYFFQVYRVTDLCKHWFHRILFSLSTCQDHKPDSPGERERLEAAGSEVRQVGMRWWFGVWLLSHCHTDPGKNPLGNKGGRDDYRESDDNVPTPLSFKNDGDLRKRI